MIKFYMLIFLSIKCVVSTIERQTILEALDKTFVFLLKEPTLNIDGLFGVVQARGILEQIISEIKNETKEKTYLKKLIWETTKITKIILPTLRNDSYKYQMFNKYLTDSKLFRRNIVFTNGKLTDVGVDVKNIKTPHDLSTAIGFAWYQYYSEFSEEFSDMCILELLENTRDMERHVCDLSQKCMNYMVDHKINAADAGYGAAHRVLYLQLAKAENCINDPLSYEKQIQYLCSYIYWEAKNMVGLGVIYRYSIDLLFEQIFVCGFEGFSEFLKDDWLKLLLLDQDPRGCFHDVLKTNRNKRESNIISNGCTDHTTGLAVGSLALFYYYKVKFLTQQ